ncbi:putative phosphothreonine lyase domain-containing protein [Rhizobium herbae]
MSKFTSKPFCDDDTSASGKWLVPITLGDPEGIWRKLLDAAVNGELAAVKISSARLDAKLGHHLVCAYCETSQEKEVGETLAQLRKLGIRGDLRYKSDRATLHGRDEYLWHSTNWS